MRPLPIAILAMGLTLANAAVGADSANEPSGEVRAIAHPSVGMLVVEDPEYRRVFLGRTSRWDEGDRVVLVLPPPESDAMESLCSILRVNLRSYQRLLTQRQFRGEIQQPVEARDEQHLVEIVASTPGAIAPFTSDLAQGLNLSELGVDLIYEGGAE